MSTLRVTQREGAVRITVRVQPRASRSGIDGLHGDALKIRVHAPPVEGAANEAVVELLTAALGVSRGAVRVVSGAASRTKVVEIAGVTVDQVAALAE
jgi:uncharacterized protein